MLQKETLRVLFNQQLAIRQQSLHSLDNDTLADILNETFRLYLEKKRTLEDVLILDK